jgi:hypothetical protein
MKKKSEPDRVFGGVGHQDPEGAQNIENSRETREKHLSIGCWTGAFW